MVIALVGRRPDTPNARPPRFPAGNIDAVVTRVRNLLKTRGATALVSSAACGADLIALREAGALGLRRRVVLPFDRARFRETSVTDRGGDWGRWYDEIIDAVSAAGDLIVLAGQPEGDAAYTAANRGILDEAEAAGRSRGEPVRAVLVWDGISRGAGDLTEAFGVAARERHLPVTDVKTVATCFVVQGFGEKTDLTTGRVLNLDASYEVIKEAVENAEVRCLRADEIMHSGTIDKPMYEWLFRADLVIADLSTYNVNAAYELGVRYGLRKRATMIVAEKEFKNPFDVSHIVIRPYEHLGKDIGRREARRFQEALTSDIKDLIDQDAVDSPVYDNLSLRPPAEFEEPAALDGKPEPKRAGEQEPQDDKNARELLILARAALAGDRFLEAKGLFTALRTMLPRDPYVTQQIALATYKSKSPDPISALNEAKTYLQELNPEVTNDPETLGLWGAVHKRLWDQTKDRAHLDGSIAAYERGFYLKQDYYNGINLAFLLNVRASLHQESGERAEAITDFVLAGRVRREVIKYCEAALNAGPMSKDTKYWIVATMWEAACGLEDSASAEQFKAQAEALSVSAWMLAATRGQLSQLQLLIAASPLKALAGL
jgi:hypothetical protein